MSSGHRRVVEPTRRARPVLRTTVRARKLWHSLHMRSTDDRRSDEIVKMETLQRLATEFNILGAIDDRNRVVRMWRRLGLMCAQVADVAF